MKSWETFIKTDSGVTVVAVSKRFGVEDILKALKNGVSSFGENRVQEFLDKYETLRGHSIQWHFIGSLQSNKVRKLVGKVSLLHSLDSKKLYQRICQEAERLDQPLPCLIQVNISKEEQKSGVLPESLNSFVAGIQEVNSPYCPILGLMCVGSQFQESQEARTVTEFTAMKTLFDQLKPKETPNFKMEFLSMGMSCDYLLAIQYGSNMIRLGTVIFGKRMG
jgi:PLP dependent protein